jgi:hypothetical protein
MTSIRKFLTVAVAGAVAITAGGALLLAAPANAQPAQILIGPKQYFAGEVDGNSGSSVLSVLGCPSPSVAPGSAATSDGHPMPGQTVSAQWFPVPPPVPVGSDWLGYTGKAHKLGVDLITSWLEPPISVITSIGQLTSYNTPLAIPTTLSLPCDATYQMVFLPLGGGDNAMSSTVKLTLGSPRIVTILPPTAPHPNTVILQGTGFVPTTTYTLVECSRTNWVAPKDPCLKANAVTVTTDSTGAFSTPFKPLPCTNRRPSTCYVGAPTPTGVDTITLAGADKIVDS